MRYHPQRGNLKENNSRKRLAAQSDINLWAGQQIYLHTDRFFTLRHLIRRTSRN
jgi:hypothetical protein